MQNTKEIRKSPNRSEGDVLDLVKVHVERRLGPVTDLRVRSLPIRARRTHTRIARKGAAAANGSSLILET